MDWFHRPFLDGNAYPRQNNRFRSTAKYYDKSDIFQAETVFSPQTVGTGQSASVTSYLFAGAKEWEAIRNYERTGVDGFLDSIDWGWFFFLQNRSSQLYII